MNYGLKCKLRGNKYFNLKLYDKAINVYKKGVEGVKQALDDDISTSQLLIDLYNNIVLCYIKLDKLILAKEYCVKVLQYDINNMKALYKSAEITLLLHDYNECQLCLDRLFDLGKYKKKILKLKNTLEKKKGK